MRMIWAAAAASLALGGCATRGAGGAGAPVTVKIIAFNDFHGNLEPPRQSIEVEAGVRVPAGGATYLASAVSKLRAQNPNHVTVSAGDLISGSPLVSALFLDEPTIHAMNAIGLDYNAVGNHEFDRGRAELLRIQNGGCAKNTDRTPCAIESFPGARTRFLAANVFTEAGTTLFPAYDIRSFGRGRRQVRVGFIGMTLEGTPEIVTPAGVAGLDFRDEAETVNALVPQLRADGADAIVVLLHQGATPKSGYNTKTCEGLEGALMPILAALDPAVDVVISGHTHRAYLCDYATVDPARRFLVTSAGQYGTLLTDITLTIDPRAGRVVGRNAENIVVQGEAFSGSSGPVPIAAGYPRFDRDAGVSAIIERYASAASVLTSKVVGRLSAPVTRARASSRESALGNLIADAQLAATRAPDKGGAQIAFMNPGGVRADLVPADGQVTYGQIFAVQPFGNTLVVKTLTGEQIKALLEQQFTNPDFYKVLLPSRGFSYGYDLSKRPGARIVDPRLNGASLEDARRYRVAMSNFLASGGDGFTIFTQGTDPVGGAQDIDALEAYFAAGGVMSPPSVDRIRDLTPR